MVTDYKELRVYKQAFSVSMTIFDVSKRWPPEEKYALTDQIRRSSRSICANIGEAWFKRRYPKHFVSKIGDAGSEAAETLVWIEFTEASGYLNPEEAAELEKTLRITLGGLVKMMSNPESWCGPANHAREADVFYDPAS